MLEAYLVGDLGLALLSGDETKLTVLEELGLNFVGNGRSVDVLGRAVLDVTDEENDALVGVLAGILHVHQGRGVFERDHHVSRKGLQIGRAEVDRDQLGLGGVLVAHRATTEEREGKKGGEGPCGSGCCFHGELVSRFDSNP